MPRTWPSTPTTHKLVNAAKCGSFHETYLVRHLRKEAVTFTEDAAEDGQVYGTDAIVWDYLTNVKHLRWN